MLYAVRLENEHIGNTDQYRATREVPLPYNLDNAEREDESDDEDKDRDHASSSRKTLGTLWRHSPQGLVPGQKRRQQDDQQRERAAELGDQVTDAEAMDPERQARSDGELNRTS